MVLVRQLLSSRLRRRQRDERGAVVLLVALMTLVLFGIAALVADLSQARVMRREAQAASDSSALAAGNALYLAGTPTADIPGAIRAARDYAKANYGITNDDWAACEDPGALDYVPPDGMGEATYTSTECISFDDDTDPESVRVVAPLRNVDFAFAPLLGVQSVDVAARASAELTDDAIADCGLCIVGDGDHDLQNGDAVISGGNVAINGNVNIQNNGLVSTDGIISVEGEATGPLDGYDPDPLEGQEPFDDPLAYAPLPTWDSLTAKTDPCANGSGIYGSVNFGNDTCTLTPGLYVITGEWDFSGNAVLDATSGVTLYFTCGTTSAPEACSAPGEDGGWLDAGGNGNLSITAPSSGPTQGMAIIYDRLNTSDLELSGNGTGSIIGTIYGFSARMRYDGNGSSMNNQALIVVHELEMNGNPAKLVSNYNKNVNMYVPPDGLHLSE